MSGNPRKDIIKAILINPELSEEEKSELIEEFINEIKREYPDLKYHATKQDVSETELRLTKEIEETRKEIKELDLKLTKEIENSKFSMLKWSFIFWISQMSAILGIGFFVLRMVSK